jgi:serine/threonine-protein kinase
VFEGKNVVDVCAKHLHEAPVPPSVRAGFAVPAELESLILRCLAKRPEDRPPSARAMLQELRAMRSIVGLYSDEDARRFWQGRGEALIAELHAARRARHAVRSDAGATTLAVDLRRT